MASKIIDPAAPGTGGGADSRPTRRGPARGVRPRAGARPRYGSMGEPRERRNA
ncbi:hypothetical protein [Streptomyces albus]|uniref:hypothetical protein n=1 Tax=Streptomyces albus TaxID=1888 RepID=UPI003411F231